jgi:hypothetical protein
MKHINTLCVHKMQHSGMMHFVHILELLGFKELIIL